MRESERRIAMNRTSPHRPRTSRAFEDEEAVRAYRVRGTKNLLAAGESVGI
jgi:hypothetical protein